jgi:hypothetical protein
MKCSNPDCNRAIGLVAYRRRSFSRRRYCSRHCRDAFVADASKPRNKRSATTYFEWLFEQPVLNARLKLVPAAICSLKARTDFGWKRGDGDGAEFLVRQ